MERIFKWIKRILESALLGFARSWGNPTAAGIEAVKEVAEIAVEEIVNHEEAPQGVSKIDKKGEIPSLVIPGSPSAIPPSGPTTPPAIAEHFDKPVDKVYGKNRKH